MPVPRIPPSGVWCPAVTLFDRDTDSLIPDDQAKYYAYLSKSGLSGLVILGTNAETFLLTREERKALIEIARKAVGPDYPIMAGVGGHSTRQVLEFMADAADAGANYALVLPPAYFGKATTPAVINDFYDEVATKGALPVVIYNFPGVCNGVDLDSATISQLARKHERIVGVKLTCGSVAKITRLVAELPSDKFATFGGQSDFLIGGLSVGSAGCIAAFANVFPKSIVRIYDLWKAGKTAEALELHQKAALAEQPCKSGIGSTKYAASINTAKAAGIENASAKMMPRKPYTEPGQAAKDTVVSMMAELAKIEASL
ncbi:dihydrodipicolinate synthetase [Mariannaea sp. PMI_226]|nr:dihydrodipicolinate synthetase [Mariannaea sp. PMI_226]